MGDTKSGMSGIISWLRLEFSSFLISSKFSVSGFCLYLRLMFPLRRVKCELCLLLLCISLSLDLSFLHLESKFLPLKVELHQQSFALHLHFHLLLLDLQREFGLHLLHFSLMFLLIAPHLRLHFLHTELAFHLSLLHVGLCLHCSRVLLGLWGRLLHSHNGLVHHPLNLRSPTESRESPFHEFHHERRSLWLHFQKRRG